MTADELRKQLSSAGSSGSAAARDNAGAAGPDGGGGGPARPRSAVQRSRSVPAAAPPRTAPPRPQGPAQQQAQQGAEAAPRFQRLLKLHGVLLSGLQQHSQVRFVQAGV